MSGQQTFEFDPYQQHEDFVYTLVFEHIRKQKSENLWMQNHAREELSKRHPSMAFLMSWTALQGLDSVRSLLADKGHNVATDDDLIAYFAKQHSREIRKGKFLPLKIWHVLVVLGEYSFFERAYDMRPNIIDDATYTSIIKFLADYDFVKQLASLCDRGFDIADVETGNFHGLSHLMVHYNNKFWLARRINSGRFSVANLKSIAERLDTENMALHEANNWHLCQDAIFENFTMLDEHLRPSALPLAFAIMGLFAFEATRRDDEPSRVIYIAAMRNLIAKTLRSGDVVACNRVVFLILENWHGSISAAITSLAAAHLMSLLRLINNNLSKLPPDPDPFLLMRLVQFLHMVREKDDFDLSEAIPLLALLLRYQDDLDPDVYQLISEEHWPMFFHRYVSNNLWKDTSQIVAGWDVINDSFSILHQRWMARDRQRHNLLIQSPSEDTQESPEHRFQGHGFNLKYLE